MPCSHHAERKQETLPTGGLLVLSRTQVHALGGLHMMELPLVLAWGLGLSGGRVVGGLPGKPTNAREKTPQNFNVYLILWEIKYLACVVYMIHAKLYCNKTWIMGIISWWIKYSSPLTCVQRSRNCSALFRGYSAHCPPPPCESSCHWCLRKQEESRSNGPVYGGKWSGVAILTRDTDQHARMCTGKSACLCFNWRTSPLQQ